MQFQQQLRQALADTPEEQILKELGYINPTKLQFDRLNAVLHEANLGLGDSFYDLHYSQEAFILKLAEQVGIDPVFTQEVIERAKNQLLDDKTAFKPYLFVDTGFKRNSQPIFALAAAESMRYIAFERDFHKQKLSDQLLIIYQTIQKHMEDNGGHLGIWGYIRRYFFVFDIGQSLEITPSGTIVGVNTDFSPSVARTSLKSRPDQNLLNVIGSEHYEKQSV